MSKLEDLLQRAAVIRDEVAENSNTAERVGQLFVEIIGELGKSISAESMSVVATKTGAVLRFSAADAEGSTESVEITLPILSEERCGFVTPAQLAAIKESAQQLVNAEKAEREKVLAEFNKTLTQAFGASTTASSEANAAKEAAQAAKNEASAAAGAASNAARAASEAQTAASEAQTLAQQAQADAQQAQQDAGQAQADAQQAAEDASQAARDAEIARMEAIGMKANIDIDIRRSATQVNLLLETGDESHQPKVMGGATESEAGAMTAEQVKKLNAAGKDIDDLKKDLKSFSAVGNIFNVTVSAPLQGGYYTLLDTENETLSALHVSHKSGKAVKGLILSFEIAKDTWKTYQYVGYNTEESNWLNPDNWKDFGSLAAGSETYIVIDSLCGRRATGSYYDLVSAVEALVAYEASSGVQYRKEGLVIAYKVSDSEMQTKQFQGAISDFLEIDFWRDFGGSSKVETADDPEEGGQDALSTGGAYNNIPVSIAVDKSVEGMVKVSLVNAKGETIGDEETFEVGTGGGGGPVAMLNFAFVDAERYCAAGASYVLKMDVDTEDEVDTIILSNKTTGAVLKTIVNPKPSGGFYLLDLTEYFGSASVQKFSVTVESGSLSLTKSITITAVDVTIQSVQTLSYTADTVLKVGGGQTSINVYKFPNNVSSIETTVEIFHDGYWREFQKKVVTSTATQNLLINPRDVFGDGSLVLAHGVLPIRIHGVDVNSGVVGNYLYTGLFVIDSNETTPLVLMNWTCDTENWQIKLLETADINIAVYDPQEMISEATFYLYNSKTHQEKPIRTISAGRYKAYTLSLRIEDVDYDGSTSLTVRGQSGNGRTAHDATLTVLGSLIEITQSPGVTLDMDFSSRSNSDTDKSITSSFINADGNTETYELALRGSNYSSNGFVKDTYGTSAYDGESGPGRMAVRIAEDVTATLNYPFFKNDSVEANGACLQMTFMVNNVLDADEVIFKAFDGLVGFYVTGRSIIFTTVGASPDQAASQDSTSIRANYTQGKVVTMALVLEPADNAPKGGVALVKLYINGEEVGACYYDRGKSACYSEAMMEFYGTIADLYLYDIMAWRTFPYDYEQVFKNYILNLSDTNSMVTEYEMNSGIMSSQSITEEPVISSEAVHVESGTMLRPQADAVYNAGIPYFVITANAEAIADGYTYADERDGGNFPSWLESRRGDKKSTIYIDCYAYFPDRPWQNFKAIHVPMVNQGTTSSQRPIKNIKMKLSKAKSIELLHKRTDFSTEQELAYYDECAANIARNRVQINNDSIPTSIITVKVDYSESGGAHNGASTELFNLLQRALGENYMTPAQNAYTGKYTLNTSIDSIPCAFFRTDTTEERNAYFHAKGNWNQNKGDAEIFGFENTPGYNKGCLNYGDFIEVVATTMSDGVNQKAKLQAKAAAYVAEHYAEMDASKPYMFSEFCGPNVEFYRDNGNGSFVEVDAVENFVESSKSFAQMNADTTGFKKNVTYKTTDGKFCHYQSAGWENTTGRFYFNSVTGQWTVTGDCLNPVECYEILTYVGKAWFRGVSSVADMIDEADHWTKYFESRYPDDDDLNALYADNKKVPYQLYRWMEFCNRADYETGNPQLFKTDLYKYANPYSLMCYHLFTDYILAVDQRSKNMMISFYRYKDGSDKASLQHLYDGDTIWESDNDCGQTVPIDIDPQGEGKTYYAGYGGVIWNNFAIVDSVRVNEQGDTITLSQVLNAMRSAQTDEGWAPFSQAGCERLWLTKRLNKWPKLVSSYDQERKYVKTMAYDTTYLYAMHGLGLHSLQEAFAKRFKIRDGFYGGPSYISDQAAFRGVANSSTKGICIGITAASDGFFTIGVEGADDSRRMTPVYLKEGESHVFETGLKDTNLTAGSAIIVIGASNVATLDISSATWISVDFENFSKLRKLIMGGETFAQNSKVSATSNINLGNKPYLEEIDIRNTGTTTLNASGCPRLEVLQAAGSKLQTFQLAQTSRIETLSLPNTITAIEFFSLPNLTYEGLNAETGLIVSDWKNLSRIRLENNKWFDVEQLLLDVISCQSENLVLSRVRVVQDLVKGKAEELLQMIEKRIKGINSEGGNQESVSYNATYQLTLIRDTAELEEIEENIEGITLEVGIEAFINLIEDNINCEGYGGMSEVNTITLENIDELALTYYNGESYDDYIDSLLEAEKSANETV